MNLIVFDQRTACRALVCWSQHTKLIDRVYLHLKNISLCKNQWVIKGGKNRCCCFTMLVGPLSFLSKLHTILSNFILSCHPFSAYMSPPCQFYNTSFIHLKSRSLKLSTPSTLMMNVERRIEIVNSHQIHTIEFITSEYNEWLKYITTSTINMWRVCNIEKAKYNKDYRGW